MISKRIFLFFSVGISFVGGVLALSVENGITQEWKDYEVLAQKLVNKCAGIVEGDLVQIIGGVRDIELLENLAVNVRKLGAFPLVNIRSDRMTRQQYTNVPIKYDSQIPEFKRNLAKITTAQIGVSWGEAEGLLADIPPERRASVRKAYQPVHELMLKRNVRQLWVGNGLYPTIERAKQFGISQNELSEIFWGGLNVDYTKLQATGERIKATLENGKEVHITNPNGTDLKMNIETRPVLVSDGVISRADMERGGAACQVWLPAGEVFLVPVPGTAEGKIVVERKFFLGKEIKGLTLTFKAGKLTSMNAKSGIEPLKAAYDVSKLGIEVPSFIDIGINPKVRIVPGSRMVSWMPAGMVTVGIGNNTWAGGDNTESFFLANFLPGCTLKVDGKVIVENGTLR